MSPDGVVRTLFDEMAALRRDIAARPRGEGAGEDDEGGCNEVPPLYRARRAPMDMRRAGLDGWKAPHPPFQPSMSACIRTLMDVSTQYGQHRPSRLTYTRVRKRWWPMRSSGPLFTSRMPMAPAQSDAAARVAHVAALHLGRHEARLVGQPRDHGGQPHAVGQRDGVHAER